MENVDVKCDKCGQLAYMVLVNITCIRGSCRGIMRPLKAQAEPVAEVPCSEGLDGLDPTEDQLDLVCMYRRHDYGLMDNDEKALLNFQAKEWLIAWQKGLGLR